MWLEQIAFRREIRHCTAAADGCRESRDPSSGGNKRDAGASRSKGDAGARRCHGRVARAVGGWVRAICIGTVSILAISSRSSRSALSARRARRPWRTWGPRWARWTLIWFVNRQASGSWSGSSVSVTSLNWVVDGQRSRSILGLRSNCRIMCSKPTIQRILSIPLSFWKSEDTVDTDQSQDEGRHSTRRELHRKRAFDAHVWRALRCRF